MIPDGLGRTLIIANPNAHSGKGEGAAVFATRFFSSFHSATTSCEVRLTEGVGDARSMSSRAEDYDSVVALGGDGVINEVVNGLMSIPESSRPRLGVIPMGLGNDFARTLGMTRNDPEKSVSELLQGEERVIDLGRVNERYFAETLSFGIDAAIAIDTNDRRIDDSSEKGTLLFVRSGIRHVLGDTQGWSYSAVIDDEESEGVGLIFAVQNGPTYGGGFRISPDASLVDGSLNLCYTNGKPSLPHALTLFGLVRAGKHTHSKSFVLKEACHVELVFTDEQKPLCQIDGEQFAADKYVIDVIPHSLHVIVPKGCPW